MDTDDWSDDWTIVQIDNLERITESIRADLDEFKRGQHQFNWIVSIVVLAGLYGLIG